MTTMRDSDKTGRGAAFPILGLCLAAFAALGLGSCENNLMSDIRVRQEQTVSPRIALAKLSDGAVLASGEDLDFGGVSAGGSLELALKIANDGKSDLRIYAMGLSIAPASGTSSSTFSVVDARELVIAPGSSESLKIRFAPAEIADYEASFTIASNDRDRPSYGLSLTGRGQSSAKVLSSFGLKSPASEGVVDEEGRTVSVNVPYGTGVTALVAIFESTGTGVLVGSTPQESGTTPNDFSQPVSYKVLAQDGSSAEYLVTVSVGISAPLLTTSAVGSILATSASGGGSIVSDCGAAVTESGLCWSTSQNPTLADPHAGGDQASGSFTIAITGLSAATTYYVRAYAVNSEGTGYGPQVSFTSAAAPPSLSTSEAGSITHATAVSGGVITSDGGAEVLERGLCWALTRNPTLSNSHCQSSDSGDSFSATMIGLSPATTYYVRAYATNSAGTGYGAEQSFATLATTPTVATGSVSGITASGATCGGLISGSGGSTVTESGIAWSTSQAPTISGSHAASGVASGSFSLAVAGLSPATTYYFRAYATNAIGTSYGEEASFVTAVALPTVTTSSTVASITASQALVAGAVASTGGGSLTDSGFCWSSSASTPTLGASGVSFASATPSSGSLSSTLTSLAANTTYYVRAYATNSAGTGYGSVVSFTTLVGLPSVTTSSSFSSITASSATGGGAIVNTGGTALSAAGLCWSTAANPTLSDATASASGLSGSFTAGLVSLLPGTTYYVRAYAQNTAWTAYGEQVSFTTLVAIPTVATAALSSVGSSVAGFCGNVESTGGGSLTDSGFCWSATATTPTIGASGVSHASTAPDGSKLLYDVSGLSPNTKYYVRAYAINSAGTGYGTVQSFQTDPAVPSLSTTAVTSITTTTAAGGGTISSDGGDAVTATGLCWSTSQNPTTADATAAGSATSGSFSASLSGLSAGKTYYLRAYATNGVGTGYGEQRSFITLPAAPAAPTASPIGGTGGSGKLAVTWTPVDSAVTYNVYASTSNSRPSDASSGGSNVTGTSCTLAGLSNYTTYYVWVVASNASGAGGASPSSTGYVGVKATAITIVESPQAWIVGAIAPLSVSYTTSSGLAPTEPAIAWTSSNTSYATVGSSTGTLTGVAAGTVNITATCTVSGVSATISSLQVKVYTSGMTGPAGGKVFSNGGSYATDGYKFMEVYAPAAVTSYQNGQGSSNPFIWEPTTVYNKAVATGTALGTGKTNTEAIVAMVNSYSASGNYGAGYCSDFALNGFSDWFLPSKDEVTSALSVLTTVTSSYYVWSSSIADLYYTAYMYNKSSSAWTAGNTTTSYLTTMLFIPVRRF